MAEMSAFAQRNLEAKHEKILKELSRAAANRRCVDCDNIGPQYVITSYAVFVCTACGGLHRQYGHRVKGISMSKFSKEEIAELQAGGNEKFMATYCAKWTATSLLRPTDRNPERTKAWIEEIYQSKKYKSDDTNDAQGDATAAATTTTPSSAPSPQQNGHASPSASGVDSTISNDEDIVHVLELTDLGAGMAKLQIGGPVVAQAASSSSSPSSKQPKSPPKTLPKLQMPGAPAGVVAQPAVVSSPSKASSQAPSPRPAPVVVPEPVVVAVPEPTPSTIDAWDPFGDIEPSTSAPEVVGPTPAEVDFMAAPKADNGNGTVEDSSAGWDAFADTEVPAEVVVSKDKSVENATPAALHELLAAPAPPPPAVVPPPPQPASASAPGWAVDFNSQQQHVPAPITSPQAPSLVPGRKEISLDTFYPEFETIRATGVLPTGQPVIQAQMTQWGVSPYSQQQQQQHAHQQHHQLSIVPPSPAGQGHYNAYHPGVIPSLSPGSSVHLSPQQQQLQLQQQHGMYPSGTPTGSYYPAPSPVYSQQQQQHYHMPPPPSPQPHPLPSPAASSYGRPDGGALTASSQGKLVADPFAHLSPSGVGNQGQMHAAMPPPPPAPSPPPVAPVAAPNAVIPGSQTQAASATLFGTGTNLTAYDLSAPAAPKARASGNPFA